MILTRRGGGESDRWRPPIGSQLKLNCDATLHPGIGVAVGGVLRDSTGTVQWWFTQKEQNVTHVETAEALGVYRGMVLAREHGVKNLVVESDSQAVIMALLARRVVQSDFGKVVLDILATAESFKNVTFTWTSRNGNKVAHRMARFGLTSNRPAVFSVDDVPFSIQYYVDADRDAILLFSN